MKINLFLVGIIALLSYATCKKDKGLFAHDQLSIPRQNYAGNEIKLNGYFYLDADSLFFSPIFLYRNGVILNVGGRENNLPAMDDFILREYFGNHNYKETMYRWGTFSIEGQVIKFERWYPSSGGPLRAYVREGTILSDTAFNITSVYRNQDGKKTEVESEHRKYRFRKFSPKPDSTNNFVK